MKSNYATNTWPSVIHYSEKAMAPHSSTLAWKIPWMEEPGRLQSIASWRVGHDWATSLSLFTFVHWRRKWQPTPVFLPGESQGRGSLVGCRLWSSHRVRHDWSDLEAAAAASVIQVTFDYKRKSRENLLLLERILGVKEQQRMSWMKGNWWMVMVGRGIIVRENFILILSSRIDFVQCRHFSGKWLSPVVLYKVSWVRLPVFSLDYITSDGLVVSCLLFTWISCCCCC